MVERASAKAAPDRKVIYLSNENPTLQFVSTGCCLLDNVLGGGWVLGRIGNVDGDKSTGKTLLAIEGIANFLAKYKDGKAYYRESEAAFDDAYAEALGFPLNRVSRRSEDFNTVEDFFDDLNDSLKELKGSPGFYALDSLDALSDDDELERKFDDATYGTSKARRMSELFRRIVRDLKRSRMHLLVLSQIRDKINAGIGVKYARSGGRALDFYATHIVHLARLKSVTATRDGIKRVIGVQVLADCTKNKISLPHRKCEFEVLFGMGIDDLNASVDWIEEVSKEKKDPDLLKDFLNGKSRNKFISEIYDLSFGEYRQRMDEVNAEVTTIWQQIESRFSPPRKKYEWD